MTKSSKPKKQSKQAGIHVGGAVSGDHITIGNNNTTVIQPPPAPETHPALGSIPPASADTYVHRGQIEDDIRAALRKGGASALVGLHAPGGTGKTELANRVAQEVREGKFGFESVLWLDVNEKTAQEVVSEGLRKCGIQLPPTASEADQKAEWQYFLLNHKLLVVFDDVRENARNGLKAILPPAPCAALITSRIQQMAGMRQFALDRMEPEQARALFVNSLGAEAVQAEEEAVFKLAERCKYNPLALDIASRWILQKKDYFPNPIAIYYEKIEKRFDELKMHGDERWNMTGVFDLSYNDLTETDQKYFRALAVFAPTGFSPQAAAHIWDVSFDCAQDEILSRFINLSLVIPVKGNFERYRLHDLLDEYALPKLRGAGEENETRIKLAKWITALFDQHFSEDQTTAPEVKLEIDNLEKSAEWLVSQKDGSLLADLTRSARNWFVVLSLHDKWGQWSQSALSFGIADPGLQANVLQAIGDVQQFRDDRDAALESYNEALKLFRQVGDKLGEANVYLSLGGAKRGSKDFAGARNDFENALKTYQMIGDQYSQARALYRLGDCFSDEEKHKDAILQYEKAIYLWTAIGVTDLVESILRPRLEEAKKRL